MDQAFLNNLYVNGSAAIGTLFSQFAVWPNQARLLLSNFSAALLGASVITAQTSCPGYRASNVQELTNGLTADLHLAGPACNIYGIDQPNLTLTVEHQTDTRLHVIIQDQNQTIYQVPEHILPRPRASTSSSTSGSQLRFGYTQDPFSFSVSRPNGEVLFDTAGSPLIFESPYLNLRTRLPETPNLYGLGEHFDPFRLNTTRYTRTIWAQDSYAIPAGTNLYGVHPIYIDHRGENGSHGVIFMNSNGMDVKIDDAGGQHLEYNVIGGVLDFYFLAGPSPVETAQQIAGVVGNPAMIPYASLGYHNCRYGYRDIYEVAEVIHNYSAANIPLETMWTDIEHMHLRQVFTLDAERYPLEKVRAVVEYLHSRQQRYVLMVDPAVSVKSSAYKAGHDQDIFVKTANGSDYKAVVWPGVTAFPDWFHPNTQSYWNNEFGIFFNKDTGIDIDYLWIDMNEATNFCNYPCPDPEGFALANDVPPSPPPVQDGPAIPLPEFPPDFQYLPKLKQQASEPRRQGMVLKRQETDTTSMIGLPNRELIDPPYAIQNDAGGLSNRTMDTSLVHYGGFLEYDTHSLFGTMMSNASRQAMLSRRPNSRPLVITRSTFMGAGTYVGHWLGDNMSIWPHYRISIAQMLQFASIFQIPMVGTDVCGYSGDTTETLCARWTTLGAFYPFYRNHNRLGNIPQELYRWSSVAAAAKYAIDIRYRMLDYIYTSIWQQTQNGTPAINPLFYLYPEDPNTFSIEHQFFYGTALLVSPVIEENSTSVELYLPNDIFYDWNNGLVPVKGEGQKMTLTDIGYQIIPLHIRGGTIVPLRAQSANTTTELRKQPFNIVVAPGLDGTASGCLYLDDGDSIDQPATSLLNFVYSSGTFSMTGNYGYATDLSIESVSILGIATAPKSISVTGVEAAIFTYNSTTQVVNVPCSIPLAGDTSVAIS